MEPLLVAVAVAQCGVFTRAQAIAAGYTEKRIKHVLTIGIWLRCRPGVYRLAGVAPSLDMSAWIAVLAAGAGRTSEPSLRWQGATVSKERRRQSGSTCRYPSGRRSAERAEGHNPSHRTRTRRHRRLSGLPGYVDCANSGRSRQNSADRDRNEGDRRRAANWARFGHSHRANDPSARSVHRHPASASRTRKRRSDDSSRCSNANSSHSCAGQG